METKEKKTKTADEPPGPEVHHEYPAIGKYRIRVLVKAGRMVLDIREYVNSEKFTGFTRRGVRLNNQEEVNQLRDILADAIARGWIPTD